MKLFLVRHGETEWNVKGFFQGRKDIPLNELGKNQADLLAKKLSSLPPFDKVFSSPLTRAFETARLIAEQNGAPLIEDSRLLEINHGAWEGKHSTEIEKRWPGQLELWHSQPEKVQMPGGESLRDVADRIRPFFDELWGTQLGQVCVVTHDAVLKVAFCSFLGIGLEGFWRFQLGNCSVSLVEKGLYGIRIPLLGDTCHLGDPFNLKEQSGL